MKKQHAQTEQILSGTMTFLGFVLATIQILLNRSLWLDEAYVSLSIIQKNSIELLSPLYYCQVAPILFLQIEKLCTLLLPHSEWGLRLFPFICYCISLLFFNKIVHLLFKSVYTRLFALSLFVFCGSLIYYSSEVKQYMSDVMFVLVFYHQALKVNKDEKSQYRSLTLWGVVGIFLSNIAIIVLFTEGAYLLYEHWRNRKRLSKYLIIMGLAWISTFCIYYFLFIHNHPTKEMMVNYWSVNKGFMPINPFDLKLYKTIFERTRTLSVAFFGYSGLVILPILFFVGNIVLMQFKNWGRAILLILPIIVHWILSGLQLYPFDIRLILYACPLIILINAFGFDYFITTLFPKYSLKKPLLFAVFMPLLMGYSFYNLNFYSKGEKLKECFEFMEQNKETANGIYVSYYASPPFFYYKNTFFPTLNAPVTVGQFAETKTAFETDLKKLNGKTWFLFNDWLAMDQRNSAYMLDYYQSKGIVSKTRFKTVGYTVYLFDIPATTPQQ
jgi:hypothetical protein